MTLLDDIARTFGAGTSHDLLATRPDLVRRYQRLPDNFAKEIHLFASLYAFEYSLPPKVSAPLRTVLESMGLRRPTATRVSESSEAPAARVQSRRTAAPEQAERAGAPVEVPRS